MIETIAHEPEITRADRPGRGDQHHTRSLQRLFRQEVGIGSKWAIRIYRLNDVARRVAEAATVDYAALAGELGYSDQAHFTRYFTTVVGTPPTRYRHEWHGVQE
jgi:transcriptional regulator GlxA family with amidase domain